MAKGDIVLCTATNDGNGRWTDNIIAWATKGPFVHVEFDIGDGRYIGAHLDGITEVNAYTGKGYVFAPTKSNPIDLDTAIAWAKEEVGKQYGWVDIISAGIKFAGVPIYLGQADHYDCSDFVTRVLLIMHDQLILPKLGDLANEPHLVTPNDLARAAGVLK